MKLKTMMNWLSLNRLWPLLKKAINMCWRPLSPACGRLILPKTNLVERLLEYATFCTGVLFRAYDHAKLVGEGEKAFGGSKAGYLSSAERYGSEVGYRHTPSMPTPPNTDFR